MLFEKNSPIYRCAGNSMWPSICSGDRLDIEPYTEHSVVPGDIVVFRSGTETGFVVHRVAAVEGSDIRTRGDNNPQQDRHTIRANDIIGRIVSIQRGRQIIPVRGGLPGRLWAMTIHQINSLGKFLIRMVRPVYSFFPRITVTTRLLSPLIRYQILAVKRPNGTEFQLLHKKRVIARRFPGRRQWRIKRPYKLIFNSEMLNQKVTVKYNALNANPPIS